MISDSLGNSSCLNARAASKSVMALGYLATGGKGAPAVSGGRENHKGGEVTATGGDVPLVLEGDLGQQVVRVC